MHRCHCSGRACSTVIAEARAGNLSLTVIPAISEQESIIGIKKEKDSIRTKPYRGLFVIILLLSYLKCFLLSNQESHLIPQVLVFVLPLLSFPEKITLNKQWDLC